MTFLLYFSIFCVNNIGQIPLPAFEVLSDLEEYLIPLYLRNMLLHNTYSRVICMPFQRESYNLKK